MCWAVLVFFVFVLVLLAQEADTARALALTPIWFVILGVGWFFDRQTPPDSLHATVHAGHAAVIEELCTDLTGAVADLAETGTRTADRSTNYGTV